MKDRLLQFAVDEQGATAIEYGIIVAGIAVAIAASVNQVGCSRHQRKIKSRRAWVNAAFSILKANSRAGTEQKGREQA